MTVLAEDANARRHNKEARVREQGVQTNCTVLIFELFGESSLNTRGSTRVGRRVARNGDRYRDVTVV